MKALFYFSAFLFLLVISFMVACAILPPTEWGNAKNSRLFRPAYDFSLRMTEIDCLKRGVNPFDVWHGDIVLPPYRPNYQSKVSGPEFNEEINAYAPWEYAMMLPLSFMPKTIAWGVYYCFMILCLALVAYIGFRQDPLLAFLPLVGIAYPMWSNACIGNFSIIVLAALVSMAYALEKRHDVLAGFCWSVAMLKPQLGLIFAIPLLMRRRFCTCIVAASTCLALSIIPAYLCHTSPITLILETPAANAFCFSGCGTWPYALCGLLGQNVEICCALAIGAVLCAFCTWLLPKEADWFLYLTPAAVCAMSWTYVSTYGHVLGWFLFAMILIQLVRRPKSKFFRILLGLSCLSAMRWISVYRAFAYLFSDQWPQLAISNEVYQHLDTFSSMTDMMIMLALCYGISTRGKKSIMSQSLVWSSRLVADKCWGGIPAALKKDRLAAERIRAAGMPPQQKPSAPKLSVLPKLCNITKKSHNDNF